MIDLEYSLIIEATKEPELIKKPVKEGEKVAEKEGKA